MIFPSMTIIKVIAVQIVGILVAAAPADDDCFPRSCSKVRSMNDSAPPNEDRTPQAVTIDTIVPATWRRAPRKAESAGRR